MSTSNESPVPERIQLYGTRSCPFTGELREHLLWEDVDFVEHDVESDPQALARMLELTGGQRAVPVLVEDGRVKQIGWQGRSCMV